MFTRLSKIAAVLSGVTASLIIATPAYTAQEPVIVQAQPLENARSEHVRFADLDLATAPGERRLYRRVSAAVKRVCLFGDGIIGLPGADHRDCAEGAWDGATPQIAQALQRAREIALTGKSSIAAASITISAS